ncbi:alpha/beta fold hydrolase [Roseinatronobacter sp.]|uniref:alpha/beta fold hydrolase n=1 Tax=Roseinatronobacter sp. TaxID=1945755 RepID=UPI002600BB04|nr:alpha/beta hydrolase [Roseibaca sp.]
MPGTLCTGAVFDGLLDHLGVETGLRTLVTLDRPSVTDYRPALEALSQETVVCGFSLGAIVAAHAADRMKVHSLLLFGLNPLEDDPSKTTDRHALAHDVQALGGAAALKNRVGVINGNTPQTTMDIIGRMANETAHLIESQTQVALTRPGALTALAKAQMPVVCMTGTHDKAAPCHHGRTAAQAAPRGRFCSLDGLGHFALLEDPAACAAAVRHLMQAQDVTT